MSEAVENLKASANLMSVLYVEDEHTIRGEIGKFLEKFFANVYLAANGFEGLDLYKRHRPEIVLTDINMPKMDGVEMVKAIYEMEPGQVVAVISAYDFSDLLRPFVQHDVALFMPKPVIFDAMLNGLQILVRKVETKKSLKQESDSVFARLIQRIETLEKRVAILEASAGHSS